MKHSYGSILSDIFTGLILLAMIFLLSIVWAREDAALYDCYQLPPRTQQGDLNV